MNELLFATRRKVYMGWQVIILRLHLGIAKGKLVVSSWWFRSLRWLPDEFISMPNIWENSLQYWLEEHATCTVPQGSHSEGTLSWFNALLLQYWILNNIIFELAFYKLNLMGKRNMSVNRGDTCNMYPCCLVTSISCCIQDAPWAQHPVDSRCVEVQRDSVFIPCIK